MDLRTTRPFRRLRLRAKHGQELAKVSDALLQDTVDEYRSFLQRSGHVVNKQIWKAIKTKDDITVYRCRLNVAEREKLLPSRLIEPHDWDTPPVLGVGTLPGSIHEIMLGMLAPDVETMKIRSKCMDDECVGCDVLSQIKHGNAVDPFRSLAIKWFMLSHEPSTFASVIYARDMVVLEGSGVHTLPSGEQIGYHLMHSIDIMQCPELRAEGVQRARISLCYLFRQLPRNNVEVFMRINSKPPSNMPPQAAIISATNSMFGVMKAALVSKNNKLRFMLKNPTEPDHPISKSERAYCNLCNKTGRLYNSLTPCRLCRWRVCSRCQVAHKLIQATGDRGVSETMIQCCKSCIGKLTKEDAWEIAQRQCAMRTRSVSVVSVASSKSSTGSGDSVRGMDTVPESLCSADSMRNGIDSLRSGVDSLRSAGDSNRSDDSIPARFGISRKESLRQESSRRKLLAQRSTSTSSDSIAAKRETLDSEPTSTIDDSFSEVESDTGGYFEDELEASQQLEFETIKEWSRFSPMSNHSAMSSTSLESPHGELELMPYRRPQVAYAAPSPSMRMPASPLQQRPQRVHSNPHPNEVHQARLWQQMNELCLAAQQTYNILQENRRVMRNHP